MAAPEIARTASTARGVKDSLTSAETDQGGEECLPLHRRSVLVTVDVVRAALGCRSEQVYWAVQSGRIRWAWEVGLNARPEQPTLRIWARELLTPMCQNHLRDEQVIDCIVGSPNRVCLKGPEVEQLLLVNRSHVTRLIHAGELNGHLEAGHQWVYRSSLCEWLGRRLVGADDIPESLRA